MTARLSAAVLLLVLAQRAHAQPVAEAPVAPVAEPAPAAPAQTTPAAEPARSAPGQGSLDFDLFGDSPKPAATQAVTPGVDLKAPARDPRQIERQVKTRRRMLQLHQGIGFATLGLLAATLIVGQLNYVDKYGGGDYTERYQYPHLGLALATSVLFATDGILSVAAPTPYPKPIRADAALLHKVMMSIATAGMVTQLALGFATASKGGELAQRDMALGHMVVGYTTFASMLTGYLAYVF